MLIIEIEHHGQRETHEHQDGPLIIGRVRQGSGPFIQVRDPFMSGQQLLLEEHADQLFLKNLGRNKVKLSDGRCFEQGERGELRCPVRLELIDTVICIDTPTSDSSSGDVFDTLPGRAGTMTTLASIGDTPSAEELASWFETLLSVQRSAVGSEEFYEETAQALVELIGLDRGMVLLRESGEWTVVAAHSRHGEEEPEYSTSILSKVVAEARTVISHPDRVDLSASLVSLEAAVGSPILDPEGAVVGMLYGSRDFGYHQPTTSIRPLEAQLVQLLAHSVTVGLNRMAMLNRLKQAQQLAAVGQALGYILHDLRGPLGNAQQLTEMLRQPESGVMSREQQLHFIDESLAISIELLNDSLEFCRGNIQLDLVEGSCRELLAKYLRVLSMKLESMGVALRIDIPETLRVVLDPARIARVIHNIAKNAGEALEGVDGGAVTITARPSERGAVLSISDNGDGLPDRVRENLFQPFGTHGKRGGTGFGLAIAKQLVDAHEGQIKVSTGADGTTFAITLPERECAPHRRTETDAMERDVDESVGPRTAPLRILVAEDGLVNQALIGGLLREMGCSVKMVGDGAAAVAEFEADVFDLILMDVEMPKMNGLEATKAIRERERSANRKTPIIALTAHETDDGRADCLAAGMDDHVAKPPTSDVLTRLLNRLFPDG